MLNATLFRNSNINQFIFISLVYFLIFTWFYSIRLDLVHGSSDPNYMVPKCYRLMCFDRKKKLCRQSNHEHTVHISVSRFIEFLLRGVQNYLEFGPNFILCRYVFVNRFNAEPTKIRHNFRK